MLRVLIVEDDPAKLQQVVSLLIADAVASHETVDSAQDGYTARKLLEATAYDLLIADLSVPRRLGEPAVGDAGFELLDDLFEDDGLRMPEQIIGLTGYADLATEYAARFAEHGVLLVQYEPTSDAWQMSLRMRTRQMLAARRAASEAPAEYGVELGIVCAMPMEFEPIYRLAWNWEEVSVSADPTLYYAGTYARDGKSRKVVAAVCPRVGMSAAAITATKLIEAYRPRVLVMTGITAALPGAAELGDVIVADQCWDWGLGKWARKKPKAPVVFLPAPHQLSLDSDLRSRVARLANDEKLLARIRSSWPADKPSTVLRVVLGPVASGAAVIAAQTMAEHIQAQHRKLVGIDMEGYAVCAAAAEAVRPRPMALVVKGVSDFADEEKGDTWQRYAAFVSASVVQHLAEQLL